MIVAIDDAGDPGFKFDRASSRYFVIACVVFDTNADAEATAARIRRFQADHHWHARYELKFHNLRKDYILEFLTAMTTCRFRVRAVVVDKPAVKGQELQTKPNSFYNYVIKEALARDKTLRNANVQLDGHADKSYRRQAIAYFRQAVNRDDRKITKVKFVDSQQSDLIQLADVVAGSIYRSRLAHKTDHGDYLRILAPRIEEIWDFG